MTFDFDTIVKVAAGVLSIAACLKLFILPVHKFIKKSNENDEKLSATLNKLSDKVDDNERDRLRETIYRFGNIARKKQPISGEEFRHLEEDFEKYEKLGGNGLAKKEMEFIVDYYNSQSF